MKTKRNYPLLLVSQFLSAFGDNAMLVVILGPLTFQREANQITEQQVNSANAFYSALFFIPFIALAPLAGFLNDRYAKTSWLFGGNLIKLLGAGLGILGMWLGQNWHAAAYFLVGVGACCYSPAKYGILPEILPTERLVKANGTVEMLTLAAILTGLFAGGKLVDVLPLTTCYGIVIGIYAVSLAFNVCMSRTPHNANSSLRTSAREFLGSLSGLIRHPRLGRVLFGCGLFWLCGATLRTNLQGWGIEYLKQSGAEQVSNTQLALLKIWMAVGIIAGSLIVGQLHKVGDLRGTRYYAWLMAAAILPLGLVKGGSGFGLVITLLILAGAAAGLFLVPLNATLQAESDPTKLGKTIAIQNFVDYLSMMVGAAFVLSFSKLGLTAAQIFIALAVTAGVIAIWLKIPPKPEAK